MKFDLIFFTGSPDIGKLVQQAAAKNLIPVILELGGKNPYIVDEDANIDNCIKKLLDAKRMNLGQVCLNPNYVMVHENIIDKFNAKIIYIAKEFFGNGHEAKDSIALSRLIHENHANYVYGLLNEEHGGKVLYTGDHDIKNKFVHPTIIYNPKSDSKMVTCEIFGPIIVIFKFNNIDDVLYQINKQDKPLVLHYNGFKNVIKARDNTSSGTFVQNETMQWAAQEELPFGGVGLSGIGKYHGKQGFTSLSHLKAVFLKTKLKEIQPLTLRYPNINNDKQMKNIETLTNAVKNVSKIEEIGYIFKQIKVLLLFGSFFILQKYIGRNILIKLLENLLKFIKD